MTVDFTILYMIDRAEGTLFCKVSLFATSVVHFLPTAEQADFFIS